MAEAPGGAKTSKKTTQKSVNQKTEGEKKRSMVLHNVAHHLGISTDTLIRVAIWKFTQMSKCDQRRAIGDCFEFVAQYFRDEYS